MWSRLRFCSLFPVAIHAVAAQGPTLIPSASAAGTSATSLQAATTTAGVNRITYAHLPSCASSCIAAAVRSIPCTPFYASCFCALPTGRFAYELPVECVSVKCPQDDIVQERLWRETVCTGFTTTTILTFSSWVETQTSTTTASAAATGTQICQEGWRGCPRALNGGCCPSDNFCNIQDCYPSPTTSTLGLTKILSPSEVPPVDISNVFPPCSHQCLAKYLPRTKCGTSPLNQTCFCQLHDFFSCLSPCSISEVEAFTAAHLEICKPLLYLTPYDTSDRWCDLKDGGGKEGKPFGYDTRMGNLENRCPDWWGQRSPGKRFGIILGITILIAVFIWGCCGYWKRVGKRVTEIDKRKANKLYNMGLRKA